MLDDVQVVIAQHLVFDGVVRIGQQISQIECFLLAEIVESGSVIRWTGIKRAFNGLRRAVVVLHVVGEDHQLGGVDETPEARVSAARDDAAALG